MIVQSEAITWKEWCDSTSCQAEVSVEPFHAFAECGVFETMCVERLLTKVTHMLREVVIDSISDLIIDFANNGAIWLTRTGHGVALLRFWVEHDPRHWVVLPFDSHYELLAFFLVCGQNMEEVGQGLAGFVRVLGDDPSMSMERKVFSLHLLDDFLWEVREQLVVLNDIVHSDLEWAGLVEDFNSWKCIFVVVVSQVVDHFETLADAEDRKVDVFFVFLSLHIVPDAFLRLVKDGLLSCLLVNHVCRTSSQEDAIDRIKQSV